MPKEVEDKLKRSAKKKGFKKGTNEYNKYVYGTLKKIEKGGKKK